MTQSIDSTNFYALIVEHARARPNAIAAIDGALEITYAQFAADIDKVTRRLNTYNLAPGGRALLFFAAPYLQWLAIVGLWRLGVISVSSYNLAQPGLFDLLAPNVLITDRTDLQTQGGGVISIGTDWLGAGADALPPIAERPFDPDQPARILLSSGTTGTPKKILFSSARVGARIKHSILDYGFGPGTRFMSVVGVDTAGGYIYPVSVWGGGGAVAFYDPTMPFNQLMELTKTNRVFMSPVQAANVVDALPETARCIPSLALMVAGGRLPEAVAVRVKQRLAPVIWLLYGSTEAGTVTLTFEPNIANPEEVGPLVPSSELRIVDADGHPVPHGTVGELSMRGVCCVVEYLDDLETSRRFFHDGWFHPGDLGTLSESGELVVIGRVDDTMNLGGVKISPGLVEDALAACPGVKDIAAFSVPDDQGTEALWVALVTSDTFDREAMMQLYRERFPNSLPPNVALLDEIPRNGMAKTQRNVLRDAVKRNLAAEDGKQPLN